MIKQYRKVIEHEIRIDESALVKLIDRAEQELQEDGIELDAENIFEEVFFNSDDELEVDIDNVPYAIPEVERYYSEEIYDFVYNMIYNFVIENLKKGE